MLWVRASMLGHTVWPGSPVEQEPGWRQHNTAKEQMLTGDDGKGGLCVHTVKRISSKAYSKLRWEPTYLEQ